MEVDLHDDEIAWLIASQRCACGHLEAFHAAEWCWIPDCNCRTFRLPHEQSQWESKLLAEAQVAERRRQEENAEWEQVWVEPTEADKERGPTYRYVRMKAVQGNADE